LTVWALESDQATVKPVDDRFVRHQSKFALPEPTTFATGDIVDAIVAP
jgi:hypothetical protein